MGLKQKAGELLSDVQAYWKNPPKGREMPFKEIAAYSVGGIGVNCIISTVVNYLLIGTGNIIVANIIGLSPGLTYTLYLVSVLIGIPLTALRANIIDNSQNKKGKYRPYLLKTGIPTAVLACIFLWAPYESMSKFWTCAVILFVNIGFQFFYNFFFDSYDNLILLLSSNSQERSDVLAIKAVVFSLAPTIITPLIPALAGLLTGGDLNNLLLYRVILPPILVIGLVGTSLTYKGTKEKIIQAKTHIIRIKFMDALRSISKNKYFWIIASAGWLGFMEGWFGSILYWLYQYGKACTPGQYAIIMMVYGNASLWGMLAAPFAIRRFGKKAVLVTTNFCNIVFILALFLVIQNIWLVLVCMFLNALVGSFAHVVTPSINGDIRDYQHYVTGERIDGMFAAVGIISTFIGIITGAVLPWVYSILGINENNGYENMYDILYKPEVYTKIIHVLIVASAVGALMNLLPYFFYDLTETKQRGMVKVLRVRALFEDYGNNALSDKDLVQAIDLVEEAKEHMNIGQKNVSKSMISVAKKSHDRAKLKTAKKELRCNIEFNKMVVISQFVIDEMNKFSTRPVQMQVDFANQVFQRGLNGLTTVNHEILHKMEEALPANTKEEKSQRKEILNQVKNWINNKKFIEKKFPDGIRVFDVVEFDPLFEKEDKLNEKLRKAYETLQEAKAQKDKSSANEATNAIRFLKAERDQLKKELKQANDAYSLYRRAAKPYLDAVKLLTQKENYEHYNDIYNLYDDAKIRAEEEQRLADEEEKRILAEKATFKKHLKEEKLAARQNKRK